LAGLFLAVHLPASLAAEEDDTLFKLIVSVLLVGLSIALIFKLFSLSKFIGLQVSENEFISGQFKYQILLLILAFLTMATLYSLNGDVMAKFLSFGNISAPASPVPVFGIKEGESWLTLGLSLSFFITLITAMFMYFQVKASGIDMGLLVPAFGWVLLFSLTNSLSEEIIFRIGMVGALHGVVTPESLMMISAVVFGLAHYGGMPSGIVGMFMAGLLGWLLMKSVLETHGIFWAWFIHFLQDIVIFSGLVLLKAKSNPAAAVPS